MKALVDGEDRARLEAAIGYRFAEKERLDRALTHRALAAAARSTISGSNSWVTGCLGSARGTPVQTFTDANEGELSVRSEPARQRESCAKVAD